MQRACTARLFNHLICLLVILTFSVPLFERGTALGAPVVTSMLPASGATGVAADSTVSAFFNGPMDPATVTAGSFVLSRPVRVSGIAAGYNYTIILRDNGTVSGWGYNGYGQTAVPAGLDGVTAISSGSNHVLALKSDGTVAAWGENGWGQTNIPSGSANVTAIAAGGGFSLALKADDTIVAWGDNSKGQTEVPGGLTGISRIAAGNAHALALTADGEVTAWGDNTKGQATTPPGLSGVIAIAAGNAHSVALRDDGTVVAWGADDKGQISVPPGLSGVVAISSRLDYTLALKNDGTVVAWGDNGHGQTEIPAGLPRITAIAAGCHHSAAIRDDGTVISWGDNSISQTMLPAALSGVTAIAAGSSHSVALKSDGTLFAWGYNSSGQAEIPPGLSGVSAIAAGFAHTLSLSGSGSVTAWGGNDHGQTTLPADLGTVISVAAGDNHSVALKSDGTVAVWGLNSEGQATVPPDLDQVAAIAAGTAHTLSLKQNGTVAGWGSSSFNALPVPAGLSGVTAIAAAGNHSLALKNDGSVVAWGDDSLGQSTVPPGLADVVAVTAGISHSVALKSDGTLAVWGANDFGQCDVPEGLDRVVGIAAGGNFTLAVKNDGTVVGWGDNKTGQATVPQSPYGQEVAAILSYSTGSESATLTPVAPLPPETTLSATVNRGVRSLDGTHPTADFSWSFTTVATSSAPPVTVASPAGGTYSSPLNVTLTANEPATIYYTTNGAAVTTASPVYSGPIPIPVTTTLKFFALDTAGNSETPRTAVYTIVNDTTPPVTVASPAGGTYSSPLNVTLTANEPAVIYFTTNGAAVTTASPVYGGPIPIPVTTMLKFFARDAAGNSEAVRTEYYTIKQNQTITFGPLPVKTYGNSSFALSATASSGLPVSYTSSNTSAATVSGSTVIIAGAGTAVITASQAGNNSYNPATAVTRTLTVNKALLTVQAVDASRVYGTDNPVFSAAYSGFVNGDTLAALSGAAVLSTTATSASPAGDYPIAAAAGTLVSANYSFDFHVGTLTVTRAEAVVTLAGLSHIYDGTPKEATVTTVPTGLAVTFTYDGTATAPAAAGSYPVTATVSDANYQGAASGTLTIAKADQVIAFNALPARTYGDPAFTLTASASSGLPVSYASSNLSVATVSGETITIVGAGSATISASQEGDDNYNPVPSVDQLLTVNKAAATVILAGLNTAYDGTPKEAAATTVPAGLAVAFSYDGEATAPTAAGSYPVTATVSDANYQGSASGTLTIAKADQTITFNALPAMTYGEPAFTLSASASSGLPVSYASNNPAVVTVSGTTVTIIGAGTAVITATQTGDINYNTAPAAAQSLTVNKAVATITFGPLAFTYDGNPKPVTVTTLPAGLSVAITYDGSSTAPTEVGNYTVVATVNDANYQGTATATEEIAKKSQTITFGPLPVKTYGDAPFTFTASASSNLNLTFEYDTTIAAITKQGQKYLLTIVGAGTTVITATQAGNRNYSDAPPVSQTLVVNKAAGTVTLDGLSAIYDGSAKAATATTTPAGLAVTFTYNGSATAPSSAGSYSVVGTMNDTNYQGSASGTLVIAKTGQAITFGALSAMTYGAAPFDPGATATSGLVISYTSSNPAVATVNGSTVTIVGVGTATITASQGGDGNYNTAEAVPRTLTVGKGTATVTLDGLITTYNGTPRAATAATEPVGLPVTITYNGSPVAPTAAGTYAVTATVNSANYQGSASAVLTIAKGTQTISFGALAPKMVGNAPFTLTGSATSGLAVSYTSSNPAVATVNGSTVTIIGSGTATITASQGGDGNYEAAVSVSQTLTVNAPPVTTGKAAVTIGSATSYFDTIMASIVSITSGSMATVKLQTLTFIETVTVNVANAVVSISGGYDSNFASATGMTAIRGSLVITAGTLVADRLSII